MIRRLRAGVCTAIYTELGLPSPPLSGRYSELVTAARRLEAAVAPAEISGTARNVIHRFLPVWVRRGMRLLVHNDRVSGWIAAMVVPRAMRWLVGPVEPDIPRARARILRCRFLAETGSARLCYLFCKGPSERFFTEELNIPLRMEPNLDTCACELSFGPRAREMSRHP